MKKAVNALAARRMVPVLEENFDRPDLVLMALIEWYISQYGVNERQAKALIATDVHN